MSLIRKLLDWFTGKNDKEQLKTAKEAIPETPPPKLQIKTVEDARALSQIRTFRDVRAFCEEVRKTLRIYKKFYEHIGPDDFLMLKKTINRLYVEVGNLSDKIDRLIKSHKGGEK